MKTQRFIPMAAACLLAPALSTAETAGPLDQIVVTATRSPVTINQVGAAVIVIDRDEIERRESRNIGELLRSVPGFAVSHTGVVGSQTQGERYMRWEIAAGKRERQREKRAKTRCHLLRSVAAGASGRLCSHRILQEFSLIVIRDAVAGSAGNET